MKNPDVEVIMALKKGDDNAVLAFLYKKVYPKVRHYITSNKGSEDEAKDIFQDAVVIFYRKIKLNEIPDTTNVTAYICTVSKNLWLNSLRKTSRIVKMDASEDLFQTDEDLLGGLITEEKSNAIENLLAEIGKECQKLLKYSVYDNLSMKEIAALMGFSSEGVAKTYNYRCKQKLIKLVQGNKEIETLLKR